MITVRFSEEQDKELLRRFLFRRPHLRWSSQNVPQCHNVVGNANYCIPFKPQEMMRQFPNIEYQLKNFPAVIVRIRPPRGATLLTFKSGRTVQMGMTSDISFTHSVQHFRMQLLQKNYLPSLKPLYFANRVYSFDVGFSLAIWQVEFRAAWLPLLFPGLVYRLFRPRVTALVFVSGKLMLLGVQQPDHLEPALDHLMPILRKNQYHGTQASSDRKSVLRQAERTLQAKLRQQAQASALPMSKADEAKWEQARKLQRKQMQKAVRLASKSDGIQSLDDMRTAIQEALERIKLKEAKQEANRNKKRARAEDHGGGTDEEDEDEEEDAAVDDLMDPMEETTITAPPARPADLDTRLQRLMG